MLFKRFFSLGRGAEKFNFKLNKNVKTTLKKRITLVVGLIVPLLLLQRAC
jgi:hypothetical protein